MAKGVEEVAALPDPVGRELARWSRPNGLDIARVATPIGVIGIIYESRPNVTADAGALALKSGNVAILRGGSDSIRSSGAIHAAMADGLEGRGPAAKPPSSWCAPPTAPPSGMMLEGLNGAIDLIIPRGGKGLTGRVMQRSARAGAGASGRALPCLCPCQGRSGQGARDRAERQDAAHLRLRRGGDPADRSRRSEIAMACRSWKIWRRPAAKSAATRRCAPCFPPPSPPPKKTGSTEYLDAIIAVKAVDGLEEAIRHIETLWLAPHRLHRHRRCAPRRSGS